jgi:hypothetical protein
MLSTPRIFDHDFDARTIKDLEHLRIIRLDMAQEQLGQIHETARALNNRGLHTNSGDAAFVAELRRELEEKVEMLEARLSKKGVFYTDEVQMYLSLVDESLPI